MRALIALTALLALPAFADIVSEDVAACHGKTSGAACTTPEGQAGTCVETSVTRPDYGSGVPPTYKQVKMLSCVATAKGSARVSVMPWLGVALGFIALIAALATRQRPVVRPAS